MPPFSSLLDRRETHGYMPDHLVDRSGSNVFYWFTNITTVGGFISWVLVGVAYLRNVIPYIKIRGNASPEVIYVVFIVS
ncbi:proline-specific permease [Penicillium subrubescens]|uniref:proline-specific permease n=1 Tax=Penicillium subrubescens TaxID=1316194 RepID=UPI00254598E9|nr:proline-specific permease [Penicillium subrubescens]KAJ5905934.1 proline-specific permease [Penicillium subrubescens]